MTIIRNTLAPCAVSTHTVPQLQNSPSPFCCKAASGFTLGLTLAVVLLRGTSHEQPVRVRSKCF